LERSLYFNTQPVSMVKYLKRADRVGIIAEFKRKSPSKGSINAYAPVKETTLGYMQAGASGLSVLTDKTYFGGTTQDLATARKINYCPILRKDFMVDEYQIIEAKSMGADVILLIASVLTKEEIRQFSKLAFGLGLEVLLEVHNKEELGKYADGIQLVGVNNRNLNDFSVDIQRSFDLLPEMPSGVAKVAESGLSSPENVISLKRAGFDGFLIGEQFMKHSLPHVACKELVDKIEKELIGH
jgi:indole-3-glycerol phosphate synthase